MENERDMAEELWEHRNDPDEWEGEAEEIESRPSGSAVVSFRLPWEELETLDEAATARGESLSEFIREAVRIRLRAFTIAEQVALATIVEMTYGGAKGSQLYSNTPARLRGTEASFVPEKPLAPNRDLAGTTP
jgi:hypothetical protein